MKSQNKTLGIYISRLNLIGGVEKFVQNFCKRMSKHYDITMIYEWVESPDLISELSEYVDIKKIERSKRYNFDLFVNSTAWGYSPYDNIEAKIYVQIVHANYKKVIENWNFKYVKHPKTSHHICVGEDVKQSFEEVTGLKCDNIIYNLLDNTIEHEPKPKNDKLTLITCSRLSGEKGFSRMLQLAQQLDSKGIDYVWNVYGNIENQFAKNIVNSFKEHSKVVFKGITREPFKEINKADYLVQLSDTEGFAYSVYEAMQVKTPCIITPFASGKEQITNGVNGYIVPFDMQNIQFDDILKCDLKVPNFKELGNEKHWINFFNFALNQYYKNMVTVKVIAPAKGFKVGEFVEISKERAELGVKNGLCEIILKQPKTKKK